jgi:hypothetical protein
MYTHVYIITSYYLWRDRFVKYLLQNHFALLKNLLKNSTW